MKKKRINSCSAGFSDCELDYSKVNSKVNKVQKKSEQNFESPLTGNLINKKGEIQESNKDDVNNEEETVVLDEEAVLQYLRNEDNFDKELEKIQMGMGKCFLNAATTNQKNLQLHHQIAFNRNIEDIIKDTKQGKIKDCLLRQFKECLLQCLGIDLSTMNNQFEDHEVYQDLFVNFAETGDLKRIMAMIKLNKKESLKLFQQINKFAKQTSKSIKVSTLIEN